MNTATAFAAALLLALPVLGCSSGDHGGGAGSGDTPATCTPVGEIPGPAWTAFLTDGTDAFVVVEELDGTDAIYALPLDGSASPVLLAKAKAVSAAADASGLWWRGDDGMVVGLHHYSETNGDELVEVGGFEGPMAVGGDWIASGYVNAPDASLYAAPKANPLAAEVGSTTGIESSVKLGLAGTTAMWATQTPGGSWSVLSATVPGPSQLASLADGGGTFIGFTTNDTGAFASIQPGDGTSAIWSIPVGGPATKIVESPGGAWQGDVVADAEAVWWASTDGIHRAALDGSGEDLVYDCVETARFLVGTETQLVIGAQEETMKVLVAPK